MKKRFILLLDSGTKEQNDAFVVFIKKNGNLSWWHWLSNSWLLTSDDPTIDCTLIRDEANLAFPNIHKIVLELRPDGTDTWSGFGPNQKPKDMFDWIKRVWGKI